MVCRRLSNNRDSYNKNDSINFETETIKLRLCDYSDAFMLVTIGITLNTVHDTDVAFKNWWPKSYLHCNAHV